MIVGQDKCDDWFTMFLLEPVCFMCIHNTIGPALQCTVFSGFPGRLCKKERT